MPKVPVYNQPQVKETAMPTTRGPTSAPIEAFGGGAGLARATNAAAGLMNTAESIYLEEKKKADETRAMEAHSQILKAKQELTYGEAGLFKKQGKDALGVSEQYLQEFDKRAEEISKGLSGAQRQMFEKLKLSERNDFNGAIEKHTFMEGQKYHEEVAKSYVETQRNEAVLNYQNPGAVQKAIELQKASLGDFLKSRGHDDNAIKSQLQEESSKTHALVIDRMLANGQDLAAKNYFQSIKDSGDVTPDHVARIEKVVNEGSLRGESQRKADELTKQFSSMSQAMEAVKGIQDPQLRDATRARVEQAFGDMDRAKRFDQERTFEHAANLLEKSKSKDSIPAGTWMRLSLQERNAIELREKQLREGRQATTDWDKYYNLNEMATNDATREKFLQTNLMVYRPHLADSEFKELVHLQKSLRDGKGDEEIDGIRTRQQIVNDGLSAAGLDPSPKDGTGDSEKVNVFRSKVDQQIRQYQKETGKKAGKQEVETIVNGLLTKVVTDRGWLWDSTSRAFEVESDQIPTTERVKIEDALKRKGIPVNDRAVLEVYVKKLRGNS